MKKLVLAIIMLCILMTACNLTSKTVNKINSKDNVAKNKEFDGDSKIKSIKISKEKIDDLIVVGKLWGFMKYYHPNVAKGDYNWDYELFRVLPKVLAAKDQSERDDILANWIKSQGNFEITEKKIETNKEVKLSPDLNWITNSNFSKDLVSQLTEIKNAKRTNTNYYVSLDPDVGNPIFQNEKEYSGKSYPDVGYRLLCLYRYWNIIEYYYPNKHLIEEDWNKVLREFIPRFINAPNELEYKLTALELVGQIHDTHANIWQDPTLKEHNGKNYAPVQVDFIEGKAVVTRYFDDNLGIQSGLKIGDIITAVNQKPVDKIISERLKYNPASNYTTQLRNIANYLLRTREPFVNVEYIRDTKVETVKVKCYDGADLNMSFDKIEAFKMIDSNIAYVFPGTIKYSKLAEIKEKSKNTKGLIIDLRCYPSEFIVFTFGEYLMPKSTDFAKFSVGSIEEPGVFKMTSNMAVGRDNTNYYKGKVVIIVNEITQSQAEYTTMAFRAAPDAIVIGSTTAGADGNVSYINLPGGIKTSISGIGVYYPDGRETQRIGIVPDVEVKPTIEGIRAGKDELLEKAISIINKK